MLALASVWDNMIQHPPQFFISASRIESLAARLYVYLFSETMFTSFRRQGSGSRPGMHRLQGMLYETFRTLTGMIAFNYMARWYKHLLDRSASCYMHAGNVLAEFG